jgi:hypothetical protein
VSRSGDGGTRPPAEDGTISPAGHLEAKCIDMIPSDEMALSEEGHSIRELYFGRRVAGH